MVARPAIRSSLFWWLLENRDDLVEAEVTSGLGMPWAQLCVQFTELCLADRNGNKITERTAKKTWERARNERARLVARRAAPLIRTEICLRELPDLQGRRLRRIRRNCQ
jgi:hypothetical protein